LAFGTSVRRLTSEPTRRARRLLGPAESGGDADVFARRLSRRLSRRLRWWLLTVPPGVGLATRTRSRPSAAACSGWTSTTPPH